MPYYIEHNTPAGVSASDIMGGVIPSGNVDGSNTVYTISDSYESGTLMVFVDGQRMKETFDYTLSGIGSQTITMKVAPTQWIIVAYVKL